MTTRVKRNKVDCHRCPRCGEVRAVSIKPRSSTVFLDCEPCDVKWWPGLVFQYGLRARHRRVT